MSLAEDVGFSGAEIKALLQGNTAIGEWAGDAYRQWFSADGTTIYAPKGKRSTLGKWRVRRGGYESWWSGADWELYKVVRRDGHYYWLDPGGEAFRFRVVAGQQLNRPD